MFVCFLLTVITTIAFTDLIGFPIPAVVSSCKDPLGMERGLIPNSAITASSKRTSAYGPENARLNYEGGTRRNGCWIPDENDHSQWLQVDFGEVKQVKGIATQGCYDDLRYVKSYSLRYSNHSNSFQQYQPESHTKVRVFRKFTFRIGVLWEPGGSMFPLFGKIIIFALV